MRDKQRAKDEVNRLNGVVSGSGVGPAQDVQSVGAPWRRKPAFHPPTNDTRKATPAERRQQLAQLAELGIAVPEEFRRDMAMAGDWQVVSEKPLYESGVKEEGGSDEERKISAGLSMGVRKRKHDGKEEEDEAGELGAQRGWGSMLHTYPSSQGQEDLDSLLEKTKLGRVRDDRNKDDSGGSESGLPPPVDGVQPGINVLPKQNPYLNPPIKHEDVDETKPLPSISSSNNIRDDPDGPEQPGIVFKKRKAKPIRNN